MRITTTIVSAFLSTSVLLQGFLFALDVVTTGAVRPSTGCRRTSLPKNYAPGTTTIVRKEGLPHSITLPSTYDIEPSVVAQNPPPLLLFFHGYGADYRECGDRCQKDAPNHGFVTMTMTGYGPRYWNSWKFDGSSSGSSGGDYNMTTCDPDNVYGNYCRKYPDCDCSQSDGCWWTTCSDSVGQVIQMASLLEKKLCIDLDRIWASGCSNGGMFTHELARDSRTARYLRGIAPIVGLPHWGYSSGPLVEGISYFGMFGVNDGVVPPVTNSDTPNLTQEKDGWRYTAYNKTVEDWTKGNGCTGDGQTPLDENDYNTTKYGLFNCVQGCKEKKDTSHVVGCLFQGGHLCYKDKVPWDSMFQFMLSQN